MKREFKVTREFADAGGGAPEQKKLEVAALLKPSPAESQSADSSRPEAGDVHVDGSQGPSQEASVPEAEGAPAKASWESKSGEQRTAEAINTGAELLRTMMGEKWDALKQGTKEFVGTLYENIKNSDPVQNALDRFSAWRSDMVAKWVDVKQNVLRGNENAARESAEGHAASAQKTQEELRRLEETMRKAEMSVSQEQQAQVEEEIRSHRAKEAEFLGAADQARQKQEAFGLESGEFRKKAEAARGRIDSRLAQKQEANLREINSLEDDISFYKDISKQLGRKVQNAEGAKISLEKSLDAGVDSPMLAKLYAEKIREIQIKLEGFQKEIASLDENIRGMQQRVVVLRERNAKLDVERDKLGVRPKESAAPEPVVKSESPAPEGKAETREMSALEKELAATSNFPEMFAILDGLERVPSKTYGNYTPNMAMQIISEYRYGNRPFDRSDADSIVGVPEVLRKDVHRLLLKEGSGQWGENLKKLEPKILEELEQYRSKSSAPEEAPQQGEAETGGEPAPAETPAEEAKSVEDEGKFEEPFFAREAIEKWNKFVDVRYPGADRNTILKLKFDATKGMAGKDLRTKKEAEDFLVAQIAEQHHEKIQTRGDRESVQEFLKAL